MLLGWGNLVVIFPPATAVKKTFVTDRFQLHFQWERT